MAANAKRATLKLAAEVTAASGQMKTLPKLIPLPTSTEAVSALALVRCYCGAIEGTGLPLVDRLDYAEDAVVKHAVANKKQATLVQYFQPNE